MSTILLVNVGSRKDCPAKIFFVSLTDNCEIPSVEQIQISYDGFPDSGYRNQGEFIGKQISSCVVEKSVCAILFRCPALNKHIGGLTKLDEGMIESLTSETGALAKGLMLSHGSEIAFWISEFLQRELGIPAFFSRGIPTNCLSSEATITGIPGLTIKPLSHYETLEGVSCMLSEQFEKSIDEISFVLVMLGSGFGVYGWYKGKMSYVAVRHMHGPMSQSSSGDVGDPLGLLRYLKSQGVETLDEAITKVSTLSGKNGGLFAYNPEWGNLKNFREAFESGDDLAVRLYNTIIYQIKTAIGAARFSIKDIYKIPLVFFGGGANWTKLVDDLSVISFGGLESPKVIVNDDEDPEKFFFLEQIKELNKMLSGSVAIPGYSDI